MLSRLPHPTPCAILCAVRALSSSAALTFNNVGCYSSIITQTDCQLLKQKVSGGMVGQQVWSGKRMNALRFQSTAANATITEDTTVPPEPKPSSPRQPSSATEPPTTANARNQNNSAKSSTAGGGNDGGRHLRNVAHVAGAAGEVFATKEEIEDYVKGHEVKGVSMPVRREFIRKTPLTTSDLQAIDIHVYHRKPVSISDYVAFGTVKLLRFFADAFFRKRYVHRAIVLETVAGVPGMVAGMFCHLKSLRRMEKDRGWIEKLLHEAENERMHLMIWMNVTKPTLLERMIVTLTQGLFFNFYAFFYLAFPRTAHRMVGYLEEEAIVSYNAFAKEVREGRIENTPAPQLAKDYYNLAADARLIDVVLAVRADEAAHRDANHNFADKLDIDKHHKK